MVRHIVLWRLKGNDRQKKLEDAAKIKAALEALNGRIPGMRLLEVGFDFSQSADSADLVLYSEFDSREALDAYQNHPEHMKVKSMVLAARTERRVADYEVD